ncbi:MAG: tRNA (adenosine(37)-N6)-threonylcarbamoyltransferase complex dimerization subunit type 1 TsaB [Acidimicrobiia bacterium]|nr:tRNA (adenosine(37)-N6)-threonylcarbamoyltransferase complex dimerization subunit type 1 TsaB [Acidimicrobiia bacterium]
MLVLALDTTTRRGSVALAGNGVIIEERAANPEEPPATRLPGDLMALLAGRGLRLHEVDAFAVATGPGSFTGLRIGIATMQGLAYACARPVVGVSALDALAHAAGGGTAAPGPVVAWVDAWRGEVYAAVYEDGQPIGPPVVDTPASQLAALATTAAGRLVLFTGDGAERYRDLITTSLAGPARFTTPTAPALAGAVAALATGQLRAGRRPRPDAIRPLYVRRPDAELARSRARGRGAPAGGG